MTLAAESYHRAVLLGSEVYPNRGDVVLGYFALVDETLHCCLNADGLAVNHALNLVHHDFVETLLQGDF